MLQINFYPSPHSGALRPLCADKTDLGRVGDKSLEARVKPECVHLYPGVDPKTWYPVVQEGEYRDEMEGLWIQVNDWVTYVLARHFELQSRAEMH
jgi:hypothetical protein